MFTSTRQIFGQPRYLPVDEDHPVAPVDVNGITKYATEQLHLLYHDVYGLGASAVRLTNVYGPRQRLRDDLQGFLPIFVRRALDDDAITVFGDGAQQRDCLYVDDVVECLMLAALGPDAAGQIFNVGNDEHLVLRVIADEVVRAAGAVAVELTPWPPDRDAIDIGSYFGDSSKAKRMLGWEPRTSFRDGIALTFEFYRARPRGTGDRGVPGHRLSTSPRRARRFEPDLSAAVDRVWRRERTCSGPSSTAFETELPRSRVAAMRSVSHRAPTRSASRSGGRRRSGRRGDRARVHRGATAAAVCATGATPVFVDVDPATAALDGLPRLGAVTDDTRAVIPVHLYGRRAPLPDLGFPVVEDAAQALGALDPGSPSAAVACSFYPTKNLGGDRRRRRRAHRRRRRCRDDSPPPGTRAHRGLRAHADRHQRPTVRARGGSTPGGAAAPCVRQPAPRGRSQRATARPPRRCVGTRRTTTTCTTCAWRGFPIATGSASKCPSDTGVHYPLALTQQPAYAAFVRAAVPRSRSVGGGVCVAAMLSRDDRRRDRGGVSLAPVNPSVVAISVFFPCYNDEATIASMVDLAVATLERVGVTDAEVIVIDDGSTDDRRGARRPRTQEPLLRS